MMSISWFTEVEVFCHFLSARYVSFHTPLNSVTGQIKTGGQTPNVYLKQPRNVLQKLQNKRFLLPIYPK